MHVLCRQHMQVLLKAAISDQEAELNPSIVHTVQPFPA